MHIRLLFFSVLLVTAAVGVAAPAHATDPGFEETVRHVPVGGVTKQGLRTALDACDPCRCYQSDGRWRFAIEPYGWLASVSGTAWKDGDKTEFDIPFEQILERANGGFQLYTEARYKKWYLAFDGTIANLGDGMETRFLAVDVEIEQLILDFRAGYRVGRWVTSTCPASLGMKPCHTIDLYLFTGLRYFRTDTTLTLTPALPFLPPVKVTDTSETTDPLLGARVTANLASRWSLDLRGEVAALGSAPDVMSWEAAAYVNFSLTRWMALVFGWRVMGMNQLTGSGPTKNGSDLVNHGPVIGLAFVF